MAWAEDLTESVAACRLRISYYYCYYYYSYYYYYYCFCNYHYCFDNCYTTIILLIQAQVEKQALPYLGPPAWRWRALPVHLPRPQMPGGPAESGGVPGCCAGVGGGAVPGSETSVRQLVLGLAPLGVGWVGWLLGVGGGCGTEGGGVDPGVLVGRRGWVLTVHVLEWIPLQRRRKLMDDDCLQLVVWQEGHDTVRNCRHS